MEQNDISDSDKSRLATGVITAIRCVQETVVTWASFLADVIRSYVGNNGALVSAAVSYYIYLSLFPVLLLGVASFGYILKSPEEAQRMVLDYVNQYLPASVTRGIGLSEALTEIVRGRGTATGIGIVAVLWTGTSAFAALDEAIHLAWNLKDRRNFFRRRLLALGMLLMFAVLLGVSTAMTTSLNFVRKLQIPLLNIAPGEWPWIWNAAAYAAPFVVTLITFLLVYKIVPNTRVPWKAALAGALFAGGLWEIVKLGFSYYVAHFANYSMVYGSLAGIVLWMIWVNLSVVLTILGAQFAAQWHRRRENQEQSAQTTSSLTETTWP